MGALLRTGGALLLLGGLLFSVGGYATIRRAQIAQALGGALGAPPGWVELAPWVGLALMILGLFAVALVLLVLMRSLLTARPSPGHAHPGTLTLAPRPPPTSIEGAQADILGILNRALEVEYTNIARWLCSVDQIDDRAIAEKLRRIAQDSLRHADEVAALVRQLGGSPAWGFDPASQEGDLKSALTTQLKKEKDARWLSNRAAELTGDQLLRDKLRAMAAEEDEHIRLLQEVLSSPHFSGSESGPENPRPSPSPASPTEDGV